MKTDDNSPFLIYFRGQRHLTIKFLKLIKYIYYTIYIYLYYSTQLNHTQSHTNDEFCCKFSIQTPRPHTLLRLHRFQLKTLELRSPTRHPKPLHAVMNFPDVIMPHAHWQVEGFNYQRRLFL